jgi:hypothetical protein
MELGTNKIVDLKIYEVATGNLVLTQTCPTSLVSTLMTTWIRAGIHGTHTVVVSNTLTNTDINSKYIATVDKVTDYVEIA